ncbi:MAG TPA: hypothetical protein VGF72_08085 [Gaiellaceae bacterium]|jgi:hypothetical protein
MSNVHGIEVQGGSFPARIWHSYTTRVLGHIKPASFSHPPPWPLQPYRGPRSMRHRP